VTYIPALSRWSMSNSSSTAGGEGYFALDGPGDVVEFLECEYEGSGGDSSGRAKIMRWISGGFLVED